MILAGHTALVQELVACEDDRREWAILNTPVGDERLVEALVGEVLWRFRVLADEFDDANTLARWWREAEEQGYVYLLPEVERAVEEAQKVLGDAELEDDGTLRVYRFPDQAESLMAFESHDTLPVWRDCTAAISAEIAEASRQPEAVESRDPSPEGRPSVPPEEPSSSSGGDAPSAVLAEAEQAACNTLEQAERGTKTVWRELLQATPEPALPNAVCASCAGGFEDGADALAHEAGGYTHWAHPSCARAELERVLLGEDAFDPLARPEALEQAERALEHTYPAQHKPDRLNKEGEPVGNPACFLCLAPIKVGEPIRRSPGGSKRMHERCVLQVLEKVDW